MQATEKNNDLILKKNIFRIYKPFSVSLFNEKKSHSFSYFATIVFQKSMYACRCMHVLFPQINFTSD